MINVRPNAPDAEKVETIKPVVPVEPSVESVPQSVATEEKPVVIGVEGEMDPAMNEVDRADNNVRPAASGKNPGVDSGLLV